MGCEVENEYSLPTHRPLEIKFKVRRMAKRLKTLRKVTKLATLCE